MNRYIPKTNANKESAHPDMMAWEDISTPGVRFDLEGVGQVSIPMARRTGRRSSFDPDGVGEVSSPMLETFRAPIRSVVAQKDDHRCIC